MPAIVIFNDSVNEPKVLYALDLEGSDIISETGSSYKGVPDSIILEDGLSVIEFDDNADFVKVRALTTPEWNQLMNRSIIV
jgi:hypothetical protein